MPKQALAAKNDGKSHRGRYGKGPQWTDAPRFRRGISQGISNCSTDVNIRRQLPCSEQTTRLLEVFPVGSRFRVRFDFPENTGNIQLRALAIHYR